MSEEKVLKLTGDTVPIKAPLPTGPTEGVKYPLKVVYCGECRYVFIDNDHLLVNVVTPLSKFYSLPLEYCSLNRDPQKCKDWLERNLPDLFEQLHATDGERGESTTEPGEGKFRSCDSNSD